MKIGLLLEDSQKGKNQIIFDAVNRSSIRHGHELVNYGMFEENNNNIIKYYQVGLPASILLAAEAVDFVITGCGTGQGAMMSMNAFPNIICGFAKDSLDAYLFSQVNAGNALSLAFAQGFGWGAEKNVEYIVDSLFSQPFGEGYPSHLAKAQEISRNNFVEFKKELIPDLIQLWNNVDDDNVKRMIDYPQFRDNFFRDAKRDEVIHFVQKILDEK